VPRCKTVRKRVCRTATVALASIAPVLLALGLANATLAVSGQVSTLSAGSGSAAYPAPVRPPRTYSIPATAVRVSNSAQLVSALKRTVPSDIVLAAGTYDGARAFQNVYGHRLYARRLGGAVFKAGLVIGGNGSQRGGLVRGVTFDVTKPGKTFQSSMVATWGPAGRDVKVLDSMFDGHRAVAAAVLARQPDGLVVKRVVIRNVTDYGVFFEVPYPDYYRFEPTIPTLVEDVDVAGVHRSSRGSANGTAEAGIWAGNKSTVRRIRVRDTGWMGIWTGGNCNDALFEDFNIDDIHGTIPGSGALMSVGVYVEHYTRRTVFRRFKLGGSGRGTLHVGINTEWADPAYAGTNPAAETIGASYQNVFENGVITSSLDGVALHDAERDTIRNVKFVGQTKAGIRDWRGTGNAYNGLDNDFAGLKAGALPVDTSLQNDP